MYKSVTNRLLTICFLFFMLTIPLFLSSCGSTKVPPVWNITGTWFTYFATNGTAGEKGPNLFTFSTSTNTIAGTTDLNQQITGEIAALNITFSWIGSDGATITATGTLSADGYTMSGTWTSSNGQAGTWHAIVNLPPIVTIAANWNIYQTINGISGEVGPAPFTFTQSVNGIAGTTSLGQQITGNISRQTIVFSWVGSDGLLYILTGTVYADGSTMTGTWTSSNGQAGTWRATSR